MNSMSGLAASAALVVSLASLALSAFLALRLRKLRSDQTVLLGSGDRHDLIEQSAANRNSIAELSERAEASEIALDSRLGSIDVALARSVSGVSLVRYDAYDEASGRQSVSIALVDAGGSGVVLSSLVRRESARMYARLVGDEAGDEGLSPEELEAVQAARERAAGR